MTQNARLPRASCDLVHFFVEEAWPMFAGSPFDYRRWIKIGLPPRLPESVPGCPGPWATPFSPFLAKTGGSRWDLLSLLFFLVAAYKRFIWVSVQASNFLVPLLVRTPEKTGSLFLRVVHDPKSRARHLSAPPKSHCVASYNGMYDHLSLIPQRSRNS